jgi:D-proline reductase (dithiol) PrdB
VEAVSIATVSMSVNRPYTEKIKPPRSIFFRWPFGHPLGEPNNINQQAAVLDMAFEALYTIDTPGKIIDVKWRWRRETYRRPGWLSTPASCSA